MGTRGYVVSVIALLVAIPGAGASIVSEAVCVAGGGCLGSVQCADTSNCQLATCQAVSACGFGVSQVSSCQINETISGHTCDTAQSVDAQRPSGIGPTGATGLHVGLTQSEGNVSMLNLPNTWTAEGVEVSGGVSGIQAPSSGLALYQSSIHAGSHQFSTVSVSAYSAASGASITLYNLDGTPDGCFATSDVLAHVSLDCRDVKRQIPIQP